MVTGGVSGAGIDIGWLASGNLTSTLAEPQVKEAINRDEPRSEREEEENHGKKWERRGGYKIENALERVITVRGKICDHERAEQRDGNQAGCQPGHQQQAPHGFQRSDEMRVEAGEGDVEIVKEPRGAFDVCQFSLAGEIKLVTDQQP